MKIKKTDILRRLAAAVLLVMLAGAPKTWAVGTWRNYMSYADITDVEQGGHTLYVLASNSLFSYNQNDQSITTYSKADALNGCIITHIAWSDEARRLLIVYEDGNLDFLLPDGTVYNLPDYADKALTIDKTVYGVDVVGSQAFLSTGFGVVHINMKNMEITGTYNLQFQVTGCRVEGNRLYATSPTDGTWSVNMKQNMADRSLWIHSGEYKEPDRTPNAELMALAATLNPGGPRYNYFNSMRYVHDRLYATPGGLATGLRYNRPGTVQIMKDGEWSQTEEDFTPHGGEALSKNDFLDFDVDPADPNHIFVGTAKTGLYEFRDGVMVNNYTHGNSTILSALNPASYPEWSIQNNVRVTGVCWGNDGKVYLLNPDTDGNPLMCMTPAANGGEPEWQEWSFSSLKQPGTSHGLGLVRHFVKDSRNLLWFVNEHNVHPSLFCFNPSTETLVDFNTLSNQDGVTLTAITNVFTLAEDRNGNMWIGTNVGPLMLTTQQMQDNTAGYTQVKVPRNDGTNYADYLLSGIPIKCMAVDGGNRKWFGTDGMGVYVISNDNMEQLYHFTTENSALLSDEIESIAINGKTGEVFIGTANGLCSYMSDATEPAEEMTEDSVYAYPNPVRPDYTGLITITGLTMGADVKITTVSGALVAQGTSTGGSFTWDGCDEDGRRVASGIYCVMTAKADGTKGTVCKIAIVK